MKDVLIACLIILVIYMYKSLYDIDYKVNTLMIETIKLKEENERLRHSIGNLKVRKVNWFSQYEDQEKVKKSNKITNISEDVKK